MASSSTFRPLRVLYKTLSGTWADVGNDNEFITPYYTLSSNPVELKVDLKDESVTDLFLSEHTIQWRYGADQIFRGPVFSRVYDRPGKDNIQVYIARSDGTVVSRGDINQISNPVVVTVRNILGTNVFINPVSGNFELIEEELPPEMISDGVVPQTFTVAHLTAGEISMPLQIATSHTWQLYNDIDRPNKVTLYADMAGMRHIYNADGEIVNRATETAPLKTTAYENNKYAQFQKTWRYTSDSQGLNPIDHVYTDTTRLYVRKKSDNTGYEFCDSTDVNAEFVGTSGTSTVYYTDDSRSLVYDDGDLHGYRLLAQLDTTGWPDLFSKEVINTKTYNSDPNKLKTPQIFQATYDKLTVDVAALPPEKIIFTSSGISTEVFNISKNKFQNTDIPVVFSFATNNNTIVKDVSAMDPNVVLVNQDYFTVSNMVVLPMGTYPPNPSALVEDTYYVGLSSNSPLNDADFTITYNHTLSAINTYSSLGLIVNSNVELDKVRVVGAVKSSAYGFLTGESAVFSIHSETGKHLFFKYGEDIDYGEVMNSYVLQENINQHDKLEVMINSIFGTFSDLPTVLGKVLNEKIRNFVANTADVDKCSLQALYGLADEVEYEFENYNFSYPGGVKRLVDNLSVGIRQLVGDRDRYDDDFTKFAIYTDDGSVKFGKNLGTQINTDTYVVSAGVPLVAKEIYGNNYIKIIPSCIPSSDVSDPNYTTQYNINGLSAYPISQYETSWNWGLTYPSVNSFDNYYEFYTYIDNSTYPLSSFEQSSGTIDWDNTAKLSKYKDTLQESVDTYNNWWGKHQKVENMIEFSLRKGLQIL